MKKGGLIFLSFILALVIILLGASAGALAYTNGVPSIKQESDSAENTENNEEDEDVSEVFDTFNLNKSFEKFTVNNNMASANSDEKKDETDSKEGEEDTSENKETDKTKEDSETGEDTETKEDSDKIEESENSEEAVTDEDKKEVKEEEKKSSPQYLFADSAKKKLSNNSAVELVKKLESKGFEIPEGSSIARMIINEMYAKHGAKFKNEDIQKYFNKKSWYKKIKKKISSDKAYSKMNKTEKKNIEVLDVVDKFN